MESAPLPERPRLPSRRERARRHDPGRRLARHGPRCERRQRRDARGQRAPLGRRGAGGADRALAAVRRFASGLHHALGLVAGADGIFVRGRDQVTRLHDLDGDGQADFYECFSNVFETSPAGHDFVCGLERDASGAFYTASGNQGLVRIAADGRSAEVLATGLRNPAGLGFMDYRSLRSLGE